MQKDKKSKGQQHTLQSCSTLVSPLRSQKNNGHSQNKNTKIKIKYKPSKKHPSELEQDKQTKVKKVPRSSERCFSFLFLSLLLLVARYASSVCLFVWFFSLFAHPFSNHRVGKIWFWPLASGPHGAALSKPKLGENEKKKLLVNFRKRISFSWFLRFFLFLFSNCFHRDL